MSINRNIAALQSEFDLLIIGGGVTGVALAREAARRNLSCCLVEKNDFGWATSAATSKLLHGGVRYLENYEFGLVRQSIRERRNIGNAATHMVHTIPFVFPLYNNRSRWQHWRSRLGLFLYDMLAYDRNRRVPADLRIPGHHFKTREAIQKEAPAIHANGLRGGYVYYELQSHFPERLLLEWALTAEQAGARLFNHMRCDEFLLEGSDRTSSSAGDHTGHSASAKTGRSARIRGVRVTDVLTNNTHTIHARIIINATGPWLEEILTESNFPVPSPVTLSKSTGIHFVTEPLLGPDSAYVFALERGTHIFIIPWRGYSLIGLTDEPYNASADELYPRETEVRQLFEDVNTVLADRPLKKEMIRYIFTGIRPLIFSQKSTYNASRKSELFDFRKQGIENLYSVAGGKWTTSRDLAEYAIHVIQKQQSHFHPVQNIDTAREAFVSSCGYGESVRDYRRFVAQQNAWPAVNADIIDHLIGLYGRRFQEVLRIAAQQPDQKLKRIQSESPDVYAQIDMAVLYESARTL
ncbi:MAG: glycerol-3-phosphate dehydrogenase/oxidase, partial [Leptospiraceae bacterium]|nr:glycerol-3-phosphate dehydrogenase/oxidase [Leptospiraceae bacterium]